jgi:hypothetical protein
VPSGQEAPPWSLDQEKEMTDRNTFLWPPGTNGDHAESWWYAAKFGGTRAWRMLGFVFHNNGGKDWALAVYTDSSFLQLNEKDLN